MNIGCSYFGCRYPEHFITELDNMKKIGFNTILITYCENDYFFYHKTICKMVEIAKKSGFTTYINPWGVLGIFGGEAFSKWLIDYPEIWQTDNSGKRVGHACINHPLTEKLLFDWLKKAIETDCDYIFWDEPHFYFKDFQSETGVWGCSCKICRELFENKFGYEFPQKKINTDLSDFRSESITNLLNNLCKYVNENKKKNNICLLPTEDSSMGGLSNWNYIKNITNTNIISTDPYWQRKNKTVSEYVGYYSDKLLTLASSINSMSEIWVQAYKIIKNKENEIYEAVRLIKSKKPDSIMFWSYKAGYPMSELESEDWTKSWNTIINSVL
ncbi:hypothetical protein KA977_07845 [Candidatus Dependentiae bacterium]|nr:hypothetical protein [Candidatus Dependentiae bacterium]